MGDVRLMNYFKFDEADLSANRNGLLSEKQKGRLRSERVSFKARARLLGIIIGVGALALLGGILWQGVLNGSPVLLVVIPLLFIFPLGGSAFLIFGKFGEGNFAVRQVEGPIEVAMAETYNRDGTANKHYRLRIGGRSFVVDQDISRVMRDGDQYKVYYADDWSEILSAERI